MIHVRSKFNQRTCGYTLLELLLSLALSVLVIGIIGSAIQLYLIALTQQQSRIERKQVARGLIQMISNDLRAGVQYKAADYGDLENLVQTQLLATQVAEEQLENADPDILGDVDTEALAENGVGAQDLAALAAAGEQNRAANNAAAGDDALPDNDTAGGDAPVTNTPEPAVSETEFDPLIDEENVAFRPTLIGTSNSISLDVSRLPRMDQYNSVIASGESEIQTPSDIKTLTYFFSSANPRDEDGVQFTNVVPGGLYRRQIDRAVAAHAGDTGITSTPDENSDLVAGEVAEVRFRYFNGDGWQTEWDSEENEGFPTAIEITLVIDPRRSTSDEDYQYNGFDSVVMEQYRSVIHLPAAELPLEEEE